MEPIDDSRNNSILRERALLKLSQTTQTLDSLSPETLPAVLHELRVHQIELEMQNEELQRTQKELEIHRDRYFRLFDRAPVGYLVLNTATMILQVNTTMAAMLKISPDRMRNQPLANFIRSDDQGAFFARMRASSHSPHAYAMELGLVTAEGKTVPVHIQVEPIDRGLLQEDLDGLSSLLLVNVSDISLLKAAQQQISAAKEEWETTFDAISEMVMILDRNYCIRRINKAMAKRVGLSPQACIGRKCYDLVHQSDQPPAHCPHQLMLKDGKPHSCEYFEPALGRTFLLNAAPFGRGEPRQRLGVVVAHDITDLKQLQQERLENERKMRQVQKMEAIGTLAGGIAHDFNNILSIILGNLELALEEMPPFGPAHRRLREINRATLRARDVVQQLLSFSRKTETQKKPILLSAAIDETLQLLRASIPNHIDIRLSIGDRSSLILADPTQIQQVLINLCNNATQAMEDGGLLTIALNQAVCDDRTEGQWAELPHGTYMQLTISDTGYGIVPENFERIFDPYFTTKEIGKGTGMGLYVVQGIIKNHGGRIYVDSQVGRGTTLNLFFPVATGIETVPAERSKVARGRGERLLIVDDEPDLAELNGHLLTRIGYRVETRSDPLQALRLFTENPDAFDLILTDMTMPGINGAALVSAIKEIRPQTPCVLITGYNDKISAERAQAMGVDAYLEKPVVLVALASALRNVLDRPHSDALVN